MADHCEICGKKLTEDEAEEGVCEKCKKSNDEDEEYEKDEDFNDPAVT
jgi:ribosome-binding protein aMBF1 (putative translation factor)